MPATDEIRYAKSGDVAIAYAVSGEGPRDVVFVHGFAGNVEIEREIPFMRAFHDRIAEFSRFVIFDRRGTGLSDRLREPATLEARMDDLRAVLDAVGSERAVLVLFTDIVGSTARLAELGDAAWHELVDRHHALVRQQLSRFRGHEVDTAGDGFFATFDGPIRAIRCAQVIAESVRELGLEIRAGLHTGECELSGEKITGLAVNIGARVAAQAGPGEVLVSSTVKDLVAGSALQFERRGEAELKGVPGRWQLYAATATADAR